jgi:glycosyltransferase involved in cell wall biosynthesis
MNLMINASNLQKGGALQVAHSFLYEIKERDEISFEVVLSSPLKEQIDEDEFPDNFKFYTYDKRKGVNNFFLGKDKYLDELEGRIKPNCVFTIFGPSYWKPKAPHLCGYAIPHYIYPESPFFERLTITEKFSLFIKKRIRMNGFKNHSNYLVVETEDAKGKLLQHHNIEEEKVFVVSNTYNNRFDDYEDYFWPSINNANFNLLFLSSYYKHKNFEIIEEVTDVLKKKELTDVRFITTLKKEELKKLNFDKNDFVINVGPQPIVKCPSLYKNTDALFLPTLLECFTANYVEAMVMERPILTSDFGFSRSICGDAATYFDPENPNDIVSKIESIKKSENKIDQLVKNGISELKKFETSRSRAESYIEICRSIAV